MCGFSVFYSSTWHKLKSSVERKINKQCGAYGQTDNKEQLKQQANTRTKGIKW